MCILYSELWSWSRGLENNAWHQDMKTNGVFIKTGAAKAKLKELSIVLCKTGGELP